MLNTLILFAQAKEGAPGGGFFENPMFLLLILMGLFFFVVILPGQRRQKREQEAMMAGLKKHDEVVTSAGIIGVIASIKDNGEEVMLKIDDNAKIRILRSSIVRILKKEEPKEGAAAASTPASPGAAPANTNIKPT